jgi:hypothetical protein
MPRKLRVEYEGAIYHVMNRETGVNSFSRMTRTGNYLSKRWVKRAEKPGGKCMDIA